MDLRGFMRKTIKQTIAFTFFLNMLGQALFAQQDLSRFSGARAKNSPSAPGGEITEFTKQEYLERAQNGDPDAQFFLGALFLTGRYNTGLDTAKASFWLDKAVQQGNKYAKIALTIAANERPLFSDFEKSLALASVCMNVSVSPEENRIKMTAWIDKIIRDHRDVRLILFGEMCLGYYSRSFESAQYIYSISENIPGRTTELLAAEAKWHNIYISFGICENHEDTLYNSQVSINPEGNIQSVYRKQNLVDFDLENGIRPGTDITIDLIDGVRVGTIICHDSTSEPLLRKLHTAGVDLVLVPAADMALDDPLDDYPYIPLWLSAWVLTSNRIGNEDGNMYHGLYHFLAPGGISVFEGSGNEGYTYGEIYR
jgi:predicted amidohydrolase